MKRLNVKLMPGWQQIANPDGPPTFLKGDADDGNPLQISHAEYLNGKIPNPKETDLIDLSKEQSKNFGEVTKTDSGACAFGNFGMACFQSQQFSFSQVWHLSDGCDFIFVTYICDKKPDQQELLEVEQIIKELNLGAEDRKWWKFWK